MKTVNIPWAAWYGDTEIELTFPDRWELGIQRMCDAPDIGDAQIGSILRKSEYLSAAIESAPRDKMVAICIDDLTRPTPSGRVVGPLVQILKEKGFQAGNICVFAALGTHRALTREDLVKKLGEHLVRELYILNHSPFGNLVDVETPFGPVQINKTFMSAGLKIGIGSLMPHAEAGMSAGAKVVFPGLAGMDSIAAWHSQNLSLRGDGSQRLSGNIDSNPMRAAMEEIARRAGLNLVIDGVLNSKCGIAGLFIGDPVKAHREANNLAQKVYATHLPSPVDVAIFNAYPKDTDLIQMINALHISIEADFGFVAKQGKLVVTTASSEGLGTHYLFGKGMRLEEPLDPDAAFGGRELLVFCPNVNQMDFRHFIPRGGTLFNRWEDLLAYLIGQYRDSCKLAVFPTGSMQVPAKF